VPHILTKSNRRYVRLVNQLATCNNLTLLVGAGAVIDAGLPSWPELVRCFLENGFLAAIARNEIARDGPSYVELADHFLKTQDVLAAATMGRYLHGDRRDLAIKEALYQEHKARPRAGRIINAIASIALTYGPRAGRTKLRIITTNYDDLIEHELIETLGLPLKIFVVDGTREPDEQLVAIHDDGADSIEIYHLHGYMPYGENQPIFGSVILDEKDFAVSAVRPPGQILPGVLTKYPTLFIGLSMTDPNLVAACFQQTGIHNPKELPWFGLFVKDVTTVPEVSTRYVQMRLDHMGIHPLSLASFGQISQVLYEIILRAGDRNYWEDDSAGRYGLRFLNWRRAIEEKYPCAHGGDRYLDQQGQIHAELGNLVESLLTGPLQDADESEHLATHLWVRKPTETFLGELELWGSSAHLHREPWSLRSRTRTIEGDTGLGSVDSVYYAAIQRRNTAADQDAHWQAQISVPIELDDIDGFENLIVGAVSLSSNKPMHRSALQDQADDVVEALHSFGKAFLTP